MKVTVALNDSTVKQYSFNKGVDTSRPDSEKPEAVVVHGGKEPAKKFTTTASFLASDSAGHQYYISRNGKVFREGELLGDLDAPPIGLSIYESTEGSRSFVLAFSSDGKLIVSDADGELKASYQLAKSLSAVAADAKDPLRVLVADPAEFPNVKILKIGLDESGDGKLEITADEEWRSGEDPEKRLYPATPVNYVGAVQFLPASSKIVTGTSRGVLAVYDTSSPKSPSLADTQATKSGITSIAVDSKHPETCIVGDKQSTVARWSTDPLRMLGKYQGVMGSTRCISIRGPYLAVGGLDRYIRVYNVETREPSGKVYVGDHIYAITLNSEDTEEDHDEANELWDKLAPKRRKVDLPEKRQEKAFEAGRKLEDKQRAEEEEADSDSTASHVDVNDFDQFPDDDEGSQTEESDEEWGEGSEDEDDESEEASEDEE